VKPILCLPLVPYVGSKPNTQRLNIQKPVKNMAHHIDVSEWVTSLLMRHIQMGEMPKLGCRYKRSVDTACSTNPISQNISRWNKISTFNIKVDECNLLKSTWVTCVACFPSKCPFKQSQTFTSWVTFPHTSTPQLMPPNRRSSSDFETFIIATVLPLVIWVNTP
jgi:hypothetical protein